LVRNPVGLNVTTYRKRFNYSSLKKKEYWNVATAKKVIRTRELENSTQELPIKKKYYSG
jgi:hypothetical protein